MGFCLSLLFLAILVADGSGSCLLSSLWLFLLDDLLHAAILDHARDGSRLIDIENSLTPTKKNTALLSI